MDDKHHPGGFDEQRFQKGELKGFDELASQGLKIGNKSKQKTVFVNTSHPVLMKHSKLNHFEIKGHCMLVFELYIKV
tara:strand:- start:450 stop:680 length:231 start_codon:yes stop_codon:yes gene_type:complete